MTKNVVIASPATAQLEAVTGLFVQELREHDIATSSAAIRAVVAAVMAEPARGCIFLATADDEAIGAVFAAAHFSVEHGGAIGWVEELYVLPAWRGQGVGARLLNEVCAQARSLGWQTLELEIVTGHERAAALYLRHGFQPMTRTRYSRAV